MQEEIWKPMNGFYGYEVSSLGRVRSFTRLVVQGKMKRMSRGQILKQGKMKDGRFIVAPRKGGKNHSVKVHREVALAFLGPCPSGQEVRHLDGNHQNNRVENLKYGTKKENESDKILHGTLVIGLRNGNAKHSDQVVRDIVSMYKSGMTPTEIQKSTGVSKHSVQDWTSGKSRKYAFMNNTPTSERRSLEVDE